MAATADDRSGHLSRAGAAAGVKAQARRGARLQDFYQRRAAAIRQVGNDQNSGKITPLQGRARLQAMGFLPGGAVATPVKGVGGFIAKTIADVAVNAVYSPAGMYKAGKSVALDARDTAQGHPTLKRTGNVAKQTVEGVAADLRHPLRHPGNTGLDVFGIASAGAGLGARGVAAAGELGAEGSAIARAGGVARALATKAPVRPRTIRMNGLEVHPVASSNPLMRGMQEIHDRTITATGKAPRVARPFVRGTLAKRVGHELKQEGRILDPVANAEAAALHTAGSKGRVLHPADFRAQQMAMRMQAAGTTTAERIALHKQRIAELGKSPADLMEKRRHAAAIQDITAAAKHLDQTGGTPRLKPGPLADLYARTKAGAKSRDEILTRVGALTPEQLNPRVQAEGRVVKGARYEVPTPGKLGKSPALDRAVKYRNGVQRRLDQASSRPATVAEAHSTLAKLEKEHAAALDKVASQMLGPVDRGEVAFRNIHNARADRQASGVTRAGRPSGASGAKASRLPNVKDERRAQAEAAVEAAIAKNPEHPTAQRWAQRTAAIDQLQKALHPDIFAKVDKKQLGRTPVESERAVKLRGALSIADERVQQLQRAAENRVKPVGLVGHEDFNKGEFRVPSVSKKPVKTAGVSTGAGGVVAYPKAPGSVTHGYKGDLLLHAKERNDTSRLVAESMMEANKYGQVLRLRDQIVKASVKVPPNTDDYLPVRLDSLKSGKLPGIVKDLRDLPEGAARNALEASQAGTRMQQFWNEVFPNPKTLTAEGQARFQQLADEGKIAWVHKDVLRQVRTPNLLSAAHGYVAEGGRPLKAAAGVVPAINRASKQAILYLKPAYLTPNALGNAALALVQQGFAAVPNLKRAAFLNAKLGDTATHALDAAMGEGFAASLHDAGHGVGAKVTNATANVWGKAVDLPFRRAAFIHEARRAGYTTSEKMRQLLLDPANQQDLVHVSRRANQALIDYGRMGPLEQEIVKHVVFFYPWIKGSTMYAGHFITEHPAQAATLNQLGAQGQKQALKDLGRGPSYTQGVFKVGGSKTKPLVVNPSGAAILTTPAQLAQSALALFSKHPTNASGLINNLTPAVGSAVAAFLTRRDPLTDRQLTGRPVSNFAGELTNGLPQKVLYQRLKGGDQSNKLFPMDKKAAVGQFMVGSGAPKTMNEDKFLSLGLKEQRQNMTRVEKVMFDGRQQTQAYTQIAKQTGLLPASGKLPPELAHALRMRTLREANLAIHQDHLGRVLTEKDRYLADLNQLLGWKRVTPAQVAEATKWASTASDRQLQTQRRAIGEAFYKTHVIGYARKQILLHSPNAKLP